MKNQLKPFEDRIRDGEIYDIAGAARVTGYSETHLRRLCRAKRIGHITRNNVEFYFTPENLADVFKTVKAKA